MPATADDIVAEWLALAESDHEVALRVLDMPGIAAFHLQQAAEKGLKAALVRQGVRPPRSHDLVVLRSTLGSDIRWTETAEFLATLTSWNTVFRYADYDPVAAASDAVLKEAAVRVRALLDEVRASISA